MSLLILSGLKDIEIDAICVRLNEYDVPFFRLNIYTLDLDDYTVSWTNSNTAKLRLPFNVKEVRAVWNRIPINIRGYVRKEDSAEKVFLAEETFWFLHNIGGLCSDALWINDPIAEERANCKILQLNAASRVGFRIPETILSNSPEDIQHFKVATGRIVYKPIFHSGQITTDENLAIYTSEVEEKHLSELDSIRSCPGFFQEYIEKIADIRVIVFGTCVFAFAIDSQAHPEGRIDWRRPAFDDIDCNDHSLPPDLCKMCISLVKDLGIQTAALDLALTDSGEYYFFEVNPGGRWLQFSAKTDRRLAEEFASFLGRLAC